MILFLFSAISGVNLVANSHICIPIIQMKIVSLLISQANFYCLTKMYKSTWGILLKKHHTDEIPRNRIGKTNRVFIDNSYF